MNKLDHINFYIAKDDAVILTFIK